MKILFNSQKSVIHNNLIRTLSFIAVITAGMLLYGCSGSSTGANDNGYGSGNGENNNGGNEIGTEPVFSNISQIFSSTCAPCHIGARESGVRLDSYENIINSVGDQYGILVVQPGDADSSPLVDKIESSNPQHGVRMPQDSSPLSSERINQIKNWINDGAENSMNNGGGNDDNNGDYGY